MRQYNWTEASYLDSPGTRTADITMMSAKRYMPVVIDSMITFPPHWVTTSLGLGTCRDILGTLPPLGAGETYPARQWAAVRTCVLERRTPAQYWLGEASVRRMETTHGNSPALVTTPPTILTLLTSLTPHAATTPTHSTGHKNIFNNGRLQSCGNRPARPPKKRQETTFST